VEEEDAGGVVGVAEGALLAVGALAVVAAGGGLRAAQFGEAGDDAGGAAGGFEESEAGSPAKVGEGGLCEVGDEAGGDGGGLGAVGALAGDGELTAAVVDAGDAPGGAGVVVHGAGVGLAQELRAGDKAFGGGAAVGGLEGEGVVDGAQGECVVGRLGAALSRLGFAQGRSELAALKCGVGGAEERGEGE